MIRPVEFTTITARELDDAGARRLAVLLGRAYTDERHVRGYSEDERAARAADIERVHGSPPNPGELMPREYLNRFPTIRNARRPAEERREAVHFVAEADGYFAAHVSLWAQHFKFGGAELAGGYIEDVATDPLQLGHRLAMDGMREAERKARALGLGVIGLATGLRGYYERLGWLPWDGDHLFHVAERNAAYPDQPLYLLPLTPEGKRLAGQTGTMRSWRVARFGERPTGLEA